MSYNWEHEMSYNTELFIDSNEGIYILQLKIRQNGNEKLTSTYTRWH